MGLWDYFTGKSDTKAIFCGLENSGKSTIISFLTEGRFVEHAPTMGKIKQDFEIKGAKFSLYDMGGQSQFRKMWLGEIGSSTKCVIFVLDRSRPERFQEAKEELEKMQPLLKKHGTKLLILANKSDLPNIAPINAIYEYFTLKEIDSFEILEISAKTGAGITDVFLKIYSALTGKKVVKKSVASAITIFNNSGIPIITQAKNETELNREIINGGFFSAVSNFAKLGLGLTDASVKFESPSTGVFIIRKSEHFIASILWQKQLEIPIEQSESALKGLLEHLEALVHQKQIENEPITYYVTQYCANML